MQVAVLVEVVDDVLGQRADGRLAVEEAELIGQVVVERPGPRGHVLHRVVLAVGLLAQRGPAQPVRLRRTSSAQSSAVAVELGRLRRLGLGLGAAPRRRPPPRPRRAGVSRRSTRTGFSLSSWSIRSCNAIRGSCKISIDWIMRGAMRRRMSVRICCEVSRRMVLTSAAEENKEIAARIRRLVPQRSPGRSGRHAEPSPASTIAMRIVPDATACQEHDSRKQFASEPSTECDETGRHGSRIAVGR